MEKVRYKKGKKEDFLKLESKDSNTFYILNENGDFSESNMDDSAELYIGDKKIGGIEYDLATETADGLMSADDKKKTNAITVDANKKSVAIGYDNTNTGNSSFGVGNSNSVTHNNSVALGQGLKSGAQNQTILGRFNNPSTTNVFAVGYGTSDTDRKNLFTIDGYGRINASDNLGFKVFSGSTAIKEASAAIGYYCVANGSGSVAMGIYSETGVLTGDESLPYGYMAVKYVTAFSVNNKSIYGISIPKGETVTYTYNGTEYTATNSYTSTVALILVSDPTNILFKTNLNKTNIGMVTDDGAMTLSSIKSSTHIGNNIYALLVQQNNNNIKEFGNFVVMWVKTNLAANGGGNRAFSMGTWSIASASSTVAFGDHCIVSGEAGFASGRYNYVTGMGAMAIGNYSMALGESSVSLGTNNIAFGTNSICLGAANTIKGRMSFALGEYLNSDYANQTVLGRYNVQDSNAMFIIGNGTSKTDRLNIFTISKTGVVTAPTFKGALQGNADTATKVNGILTITKGAVNYTYDGSSSVKLDLSDVSGGGDTSQISIVQSTGYSAEDVMSQNATTIALYEGMPKFNGFVERVQYISGSTPSDSGYVVYDNVIKTFRFYNTDNSTYYLGWADVANYVNMGGTNGSTPISNRLYMFNKQHYIFENGDLKLVSNGSVDLSDYYTKTEVNSELGKKANTADLSTVANTGDYNDLENKPNIPSVEGLASEAYVQQQVSNIEIKAGSFKSAQQKAKNNNGIWTWMLEEGEIKKPIWHIGDGNFIDAVGALIRFETEPAFRYTIMLDEDNATTYVPIVQNRLYDMVVDWGDGSEPQSYVQAGAFKGLSHAYIGNAGTKYQITLKGTSVDTLAFEDSRAFNKIQLFSIDDNTLQSSTIFGYDSNNSFKDCVNLVSVSANALSNSIHSNVLSFTGCSSLKTLPVGILDNKELTRLDNFVAGCTILELSEDFMTALAQKISNAKNFLYAFNGCKGKIHIPDNFFDDVVGGVTDVRHMTGNATGVTGDAKALYDVLKNKVAEGAGTVVCFAGVNLSNRNQVPTAWGGTMI